MLPKGYTIKTSSTADFPRPGFFRSSYGLLLIALGSGILMGLTAAPANAWLLAWVAFAPLWVIILAPGSLSPLLAAAAWAVGYHGLALAWIRDLHPLTWMGVPWLASIAITGFCWAFITLWGVIWVMLWVWGMRRLCRTGVHERSRKEGGIENLELKIEPSERKPHPSKSSLRERSTNSTPNGIPVWLKVLIGTALWIGLDTLWGQGVLYWTSLAFTQSPHNLVLLHLGQISGPWTVTAAIVAFNGILAEAWLQFQWNQRFKAKQLLIFNAAFLLALHLLGFVLYSQALVNESTSAFKVGIVQGNIPTRIKLFEQGLQLSLDHYLKGYETLVEQGVDAVLTSEGALPWLWISRPIDNPLYQSIVEKGVPAWVGTVGLRQGRITQTLFSISGTGEIVGRYDKVKLVPLGEYIPFESVLSRLINRLSPVEASMLPGQLNQRFDTPLGQAIGGICYESGFAELFRRQAANGGQFILTASNNDPYGRAMMTQHHAQDVMRSIETDRWAVRSTNTGLSGIVDPHGRTQWLSGFRTYETHAHTVYRRQTQTLYVRWGNWLTPVLLVLSSVLWIRWRSSELREF